MDQSDLSGLLGVFIGGGIALLGTFLVIWHERNMAAKKRESELFSCAVSSLFKTKLMLDDIGTLNHYWKEMERNANSSQFVGDAPWQIYQSSIGGFKNYEYTLSEIEVFADNGRFELIDLMLAYSKRHAIVVRGSEKYSDMRAAFTEGLAHVGMHEDVTITTVSESDRPKFDAETTRLNALISSVVEISDQAEAEGQKLLKLKLDYLKKRFPSKKQPRLVANPE